MNENERGKLEIRLNFWINHNKEHEEELQEWAHKAGDAGGAVQHYMLQAVQAKEKTGGYLLRALEVLKGKSSQDRP